MYPLAQAPVPRGSGAGAAQAEGFPLEHRVQPCSSWQAHGMETLERESMAVPKAVSISIDITKQVIDSMNEFSWLTIFMQLKDDSFRSGWDFINIHIL